MPDPQIVKKIASGEAVLLTADQISNRLGISRSTFDRWVRNSSKKNTPNTEKNTEIGTFSPGGFQMTVGSRMRTLEEIQSNDDEASFPEHDIRIGKSPRWLLETFEKWIQNNMS
ncbi:helix-turn-helix domain-containing protein [Rhodospirillum sp. A1_3_36]|uniref:helix-turn-helix domain-containing protein n=1 Tax=Rhodospirillum sp. A1_3_36 TaxID=3391666 RepID=UPI0039A61486